VHTVGNSGISEFKTGEKKSSKGARDTYIVGSSKELSAHGICQPYPCRAYGGILINVAELFLLAIFFGLPPCCLALRTVREPIAFMNKLGLAEKFSYNRALAETILQHHLNRYS
jgi:hypothetical protein